MENIVLVGASGHAHAVIEAVERESKYRIAGVIDTFKPAGHMCLGYAVLGGEAQLPELIRRHEISGAIVAIGDNWLRHVLVERIRSIVPDLPFVSAIHPSAEIARSARVGAGSVILPGAIVCANGVVGEFCIVNTKASLDHDGRMEDFSSFAPAVTAGGVVRIRQFAAVMLGVDICHSVCIGEHSVVGAGSLVLKDIPDFVVAYGSPARVVRTRKAGEPYMDHPSCSE